MSNCTSHHDQGILKAHYFEFMPYFKLTNDGRNMDGICGILFNYIIRSMDIRYERISTNVGPLLGSKQKDGSWNGIAGAIHRNETQFSLFMTTLVHNDVESVQQSFPFWFSSYVILSGLPPLGFKTVCFSVFIPFDETTMIGLAISFIILTLMSFAMERKRFHVLPTERRKTRVVPFAKHCTLFIRPILYQTVANVNIIPISSPAKLCFIMWWMTMIIIANLFSSHLKAASSSMSEPFHFNRLEDVENFPNMRIIMFKSPGLIKYFERSPYPLNRAIYQQSQRYNGIVSAVKDYYSETNMEETRMGRSIIIAGTPSLLEKLKEECRNNKTYTISKDSFNYVPMSLIFAKSLGGCFLNEVNIRIIRFFETGNTGRYMNGLRKSLTNCLGRNAAQKSAHTVFTFEDLRVFLIFYSFGVTASIAIFVAEICTICFL